MRWLVWTLLLISRSGAAQSALDVLNYRVRLTPHLTDQSVRGEVLIRFRITGDVPDSIAFDCGALTLTTATHQAQPLPYSVHDRRVWLAVGDLSPADSLYEVALAYHGTPPAGIRFFPAREQVYTVFSTSQWMVCVDAPDDKATFELALAVPTHWQTVGNGALLRTETLPDGTALHTWRQDAPVSTYLFGFAAGPFQQQTWPAGQTQLRFLTDSLSKAEVRQVFATTGDILHFFEEKAGVPYPDSVYTQVLAAGRVAQEMSSFAVMRESYGPDALADAQAIWLSAHELAHQWWGNGVTCADWAHFWLNEGMANFMTAAYKEHRFGRAAYAQEIEVSRAAYEKVKAAGHDRALVFPDWNHPSADDRTLVYNKGAYVLHLLRQELGDARFWKALRAYTQTYFGQSVTTVEFQRAMERASGRKLQAFFDRWVYHPQN
ncbi:Peptidase family M1 [Catalinimonas alkaloidigena]|uniref:Aminopeptidase N n=2 Tax=Catalinimonas alkaloidigena TaxID=1075417 RepID=A0A1G9IKA8_9BACT|nr:Peptidase family M1 [Catalinimonas alkaloidigena]